MATNYVDWVGVLGAFQVNLPEISCFVDIETGEVFRLEPGDERLAEFRGASHRYKRVEAVPSRVQYQWLDQFVQAVEDPSLRSRMLQAINGKGAFRRFKDILLTLPDDRRRWFEFRDAKLREFIVQWVKSLGIEPENPPEWDAESEPTPTSPTVLPTLAEEIAAYLKDNGGNEDAAEGLAAHLAETFRIVRI